MDLRRIRKNINTRDWASKSIKQNINYIKTQLKRFGLSLPKYLSTGKITDSQIRANVKRLDRAIEKEIYSPKTKTYNQAYNELQKVVESHNKKVFKKLGYLSTYGLTENQMNFMIGREVGIDGYKVDNKYMFQRSDTQFSIEDLTNSYFADVTAIEQRITQIKAKDKRLHKKTIDKELRNDSVSLKRINDYLNNWYSDGYLRKSENDIIKSQIKNLSGAQQTALFTMLSQSNTKTKYIISDDDKDNFELNLKNKVSRLIHTAQHF